MQKKKNKSINIHSVVFEYEILKIIFRLKLMAYCHAFFLDYVILVVMLSYHSKKYFEELLKKNKEIYLYYIKIFFFGIMNRFKKI